VEVPVKCTVPICRNYDLYVTARGFPVRDSWALADVREQSAAIGV